MPDVGIDIPVPCGSYLGITGWCLISDEHSWAKDGHVHPFSLQLDPQLLGGGSHQPQI